MSFLLFVTELSYPLLEDEPAESQISGFAKCHLQIRLAVNKAVINQDDRVVKGQPSAEKVFFFMSDILLPFFLQRVSLFSLSSRKALPGQPSKCGHVRTQFNASRLVV
jgi:hypothetical protein